MSVELRTMRAISPAAKSSPFQATKLWNQMIRNFREGIELKKRRWKMKSHENSFSGHDAVDWFLLYLRSNQKFGDHSTRAQAKMLLQKFLENGIIEDARGKDKSTFEDDNHLYRFTEKTENICKSKTEIATQRSVTNLLRSVSVRRKTTYASSSSQGSLRPSNSKNNVVTRSQSMRQALMSPNASIMPPPQATGVTPVAQTLDAFSIDSAEKPFREKSVDVEPKRNSGVADEEIKISELEQPDFDESQEENYNSILQNAGIDNRAFIVEAMSPFVTPFQRTWSLRDAKSMKYRHKFVVNCEEEDAQNEPSFVINKSIRRNKIKRTKSSKLVTGISFMKTENCDSPTKRNRAISTTTETCGSPTKRAKITNDCQPDESKSLQTPTCNSIDKQTVQTSEKENDVPKMDFVPNSFKLERKRYLRPATRSDTSLRRLERKASHSKRTNSYHSALGDGGGSIFRTEALVRLKDSLEMESLDDVINVSLVTDYDTETNVKMELKSAEIPEWTLSAMKYLVEWPNSKKSEIDGDLPTYEGFESDVFRAVQDHYESTLKEPLMTYNMFKIFDTISDLIAKDPIKVQEILQHICLLIPTWNRKQMYLILRFMDKIAKNMELKLSKDLPNKELVVRSFHRAIARNKEMNNPERDDMTSIRVVMFMVENHESILKVPEELKYLDQKSNETPAAMEQENQQAVIKRDLWNKRPQRPISYCVQYTKNEFAKQAEDCTKKALSDLLNLIVGDDTLHPKIKKKRLKEFKKNYPHIYQKKFPEDNISTCSTSSQRTLRIRQAIRPFFFKKGNSEF